MNTYCLGCTAWINPYNINFALTNVLRINATESTLSRVQNYIAWYLSHTNNPDQWGVNGTMYDYDVTSDGREVSRNDADSTDSYAATFLTLVRSYLDASGQKDWVKNQISSLKMIANSIWATFDSNIGLTYAKPNYMIAYLMDNVEVWRGLQDFSNLLGDVSDSDAQHYQDRASLIRTGIETKLWNPSRSEYQIAYNNPSQAVDWNIFYPDASANMWPLLFELPDAINSPRREILYRKFSDNQLTKWSQLQSGDFPFTLMGEIVQMNEQNETTKSNVLTTFVNSITAKYFPDRQWTWHIAESSWFAVLLNNKNY